MKYLLSVFLIFFIQIQPVYSNQVAPSVLLLNSYHPQYAWTHQITKGVIEVLKQSVPPENIHVEYMDSRRFLDDDVFALKVKEILDYKYDYYKPDLIITSDDHAFNFMIENRETMFADIPIIFCGVNIFNPVSLDGIENVTGILEGMEIEGNLKLIQQVQPNVNRIIMLGDKTGLGLRLVENAKAIIQNWSHQSINIDIWDDFSLDELYEASSRLTPDTAFLVLAIHRDRLGQYFSFEKELQELSSHSAVPVYGMWGGLMIGNGALGGMMNDPYEHGKSVGEMALTVLSGVSTSDIPITPKSKFMPFFDYEQLIRFDIDIQNLPKGSAIVNKPISVYETYKTQINSFIVLVVMLILIISVLMENIQRRIHSENQLDQLNKHLEEKVAERTLQIKQRNSELEYAHKRMEELANTDALTGLGNRRAAQHELKAYINRTRREGKTLSVALLDIDFFKRVNDEHGHQVGDDVLFGFAQVVKNAIRPSDRIYRWGGEEFLVLLPNTDGEFATAVCNRIIKNLRAHIFEVVGTVTASIGVASLQPDDEIDSLVNRSDDYLYKAKDNGRDQVMAV